MAYSLLDFSILGLIDAITGSLVVILGVIFGVFFIYQGHKKNVKMLQLLGLVSSFAGLMYLGVLLDFGWLLIREQNFEKLGTPLSSYIWFPLVMVIAIYIAARILFPEKAKYFILVYLIMGIIFYFLIFSFSDSSFYTGFYEKSDPRLWDYNINVTSLAGIFLALMLFPVILIFGGGLLYKSTKTTGTLKKKFIALALGAFSYGFAGLFEGFTQPGIGVILVRIVYLSSFWFMYYGLKPVE
ncbi:MAG: hypothetical protein R6U96_13830 [Promethearchaeia archaeon]